MKSKASGFKGLSRNLRTMSRMMQRPVSEAVIATDKTPRTERGRQTLTFGPLKPVGLEDPTTGKRYQAVLQLHRRTVSHHRPVVGACVLERVLAPGTV